MHAWFAHEHDDQATFNGKSQVFVYSCGNRVENHEQNV